MIKARITVTVILVLMLLVAPLAAGAQSVSNPARIGILRIGSAPDPFVEAFKQALRDLGYTEGRNVSIEYRWAEGREERLASLAADLVRLKVDVMVVGGTVPARAAKDATTTIPIVVPVATDLVGAGLAASLGRPGANVTGFASQSEDLPGKWVELLKEALPRISRVAALSDPESDAGQAKAAETAARSLGVRLHVLKARRPDDFVTAFAEAQKKGSEALIVLASASFYAHRAHLVPLAARHRLPVLYHHKEFVVGGGLMSYGADFQEMWRRAAGYVDRILKGAKPTDLPIAQPTKFELVINLKTAASLGLTFPQSLLVRADQIISQ
jgi:putative tryptophan/tyrosine transport system substrate-binding protein